MICGGSRPWNLQGLIPCTWLIVIVADHCFCTHPSTVCEFLLSPSTLESILFGRILLTGLPWFPPCCSSQQRLRHQFPCSTTVTGNDLRPIRILSAQGIIVYMADYTKTPTISQYITPLNLHLGYLHDHCFINKQ